MADLQNHDALHEHKDEELEDDDVVEAKEEKTTGDWKSDVKDFGDLEKQEEVKLTTRYPGAMKPMAGHSAFLQKRLAKGQKYFDSGDYQMAKQTGKSNNLFSSRMMPLPGQQPLQMPMGQVHPRGIPQVQMEQMNPGTGIQEPTNLTAGFAGSGTTQPGQYHPH